MQARAGAMDELLASGALNDLSTPVDDIQKELDKVSATSQVDNELAALKLELGTGGAGGRTGGRRHGGPAGRRPERKRKRRNRRLMALSHNIKPDRGLTTRMLMTGFFLVVLYAVLIGVLFIFLKSLVLILVIAFGLLFCQYFFSDKIAMFAMHAKEVTPQEAPELHGVIDRLCALADMPKPRVAIAQTDVPNAFATGRSPKAAVVCATTGLLRRLDEPEVEAVLAHEISHVAHRDVAVMTIASGLGMIAGLLDPGDVLLGDLRRGRPRRTTTTAAGQLVLIEMVVMLVSIVVYFVSFLLTMALSRYRELAADRSGAILIGQPVAAGLGPDQDLRGDGPHPDQGPAGRRAVQRLLLRAGRWPGGPGPAAGPGRGRLQLRRACSAPTPPSSAGWPSSTSSSTSSAKPADHPLLTWASSTRCSAAPSRSRPTSMRCSPCPRRR